MRAVLPALAVYLIASPVARAALPPVFEDAPLRAVHFVDKNEGWAVGDEGNILHSIDGGKSWDRQKSGTRASLRAMQFLTPYTGWIVGRLDRPSGSVGVVMKTTDAGLTWTEVSSGMLPGLNVVRFFDETTGIVAGDGSNAFPAGVFLTRDGGVSWSPSGGARCPTCLAAHFRDTSSGVIGGAWGTLSTYKDGTLTAASADIPGGRAVRAIAAPEVSAPTAGAQYAVGDGGMILTSSEGGKTWDVRSPAVAAAALASCDFHCVAAVGSCVWVAGRPGSVVFFSPDAGKTWEPRKTGIAVPLNGLCMISEADGWACGEFGTILGTHDGGKSWAILRTGGQRAALLFAHAGPAGVPLAALPGLGAKDGYLGTALALTTADPSTASPERAADEFRFPVAVRAAGGAAAESVWGFPLPGHCEGLTAEQLLAYWDGRAAGKARDYLLRQFVLAIRVWRPDVLVTDTLSPDAPAAEQAMLFAAREAFRMAADPASYPEQLDQLGLAPHAVKKLYALARDNASAQVKMGAAAFRPELAETPAALAEAGGKLLGGRSGESPAFRLVSHRLDGSEKHTTLLEGCDLARGGTARRLAELPAWTPQYVTLREGVAGTRKRAAELMVPAAVEKGGEAAFSHLAELLKTVPDDAAADITVSLADGFVRSGRWTIARELYLFAANQYPTQPATVGACHWLVRYHASGEAFRRLELAQHPTFRPTVFAQTQPQQTEGVTRVNFAEPAGPRTRFRSSEGERAWVGTTLDMESRLFAADPIALRDPMTQLAFNASRLRLGLTADSARSLAAYRGGLGRHPSPWLDAVASELWLSNRNLAPAPSKPVAVCLKADAVPQLDGKLDDACWLAAAPLPVATGDLNKQNTTEARLCFDNEFLYLGVSCTHPAREPAIKATKRRRDEDLGGHDRVEILLDLDRDYQSYYRLQVDDRGCVAEDCWGDGSWNPRWFVAVEATPTGWTAEVAIPLAELTGTRPRNASVWAANVVRVVPGQGVAAWNGPADTTPRPEGMGLLEFRAK